MGAPSLVKGLFLGRIIRFSERETAKGAQAFAGRRGDLASLHGFAEAEIKLPRFGELSQTPGLAPQARRRLLEEQGVLGVPERSRDRRDFSGGKHEGASLVAEVAQEGVLAAKLGVATPSGLDLRIGGHHRSGA